MKQFSNLGSNRFGRLPMYILGMAAVMGCLSVGEKSAWAQPALTVTAVPLGGTTLQGGQTVDVEFFLTANRNIRLEGAQLDLPCTVTGSISNSMIVESGTADPDGDAVPGPSTAGTAFVFPGGIGLYSTDGCRLAAAPPLGATGVNISAGAIRYLGTIRYKLDACSAGTFRVELEGTSNPPLVNDSSRFYEDEPPGPGPRRVASFAAPPLDLSVPIGRCCAGSSCIGDLNEHCCRVVQSGTSWEFGAMCPGGCACDSNASCDDANACTSETCIDGQCRYQPVVDGTSCTDELFCTAQDICTQGICAGSANACPGRRCNEELNACVDCLTHADCADTNPCTEDLCNALGQCERSFNTASCDDGRFCTTDDRCSRGRCVGLVETCVGQFCNEAVDICQDCGRDLDCDDGIDATVDTCRNGLCFHQAEHRVALTFMPLPGIEVQGGTTVRIEVFITALSDVRLDAIQIDLPCSLPGGSSGAITAISGTTDPNDDGLRGPSVHGTPFVFGPSGYGPVNKDDCLSAAVRNIGNDTPTLPVGQTRYLATWTYAVTDCAAGEFTLGFEGLSDPPQSTDRTRVREDEPPGPGIGPLISVGAPDIILYVPVGRCCRNGECLGEMNAHCCLNLGGGTEWAPGASCETGCTCETEDDCNDANTCTRDLCTSGVCTHEALPNGRPCRDGLFCTADDTCREGVCVPGNDRCPPPAILCDEKNDRCIECLKHHDCNDGNECTTDRCDVITGLCHHENNSKPCNDGLYCTKPDVCSNGICSGTPRRCPVGEVCNEEADRCVPNR